MGQRRAGVCRFCHDRCLPAAAASGPAAAGRGDLLRFCTVATQLWRGGGPKAGALPPPVPSPALCLLSSLTAYSWPFPCGVGTHKAVTVTLW